MHETEKKTDSHFCLKHMVLALKENVAFLGNHNDDTNCNIYQSVDNK